MKLDLILENVRNRYSLGLLEESEGMSEKDLLKGKILINESTMNIRKMLVEEGVIAQVQTNLEEAWTAALIQEDLAAVEAAYEAARNYAAPAVEAVQNYAAPAVEAVQTAAAPAVEAVQTTAAPAVEAVAPAEPAINPATVAAGAGLGAAGLLAANSQAGKQFVGGVKNPNSVGYAFTGAGRTGAQIGGIKNRLAGMVRR